MAERSDRVDEVAEVSAAAGGIRARTEQAQRARRMEALSYHLAGLSWEQIGERLGVTQQGAFELVERTLRAAERQGVDQMRETENMRLDRAQSGIWAGVLQGDLKAIAAFLKISEHRSKINGLYAPTKIDVAMSVRTELTRALDRLDEIVLPILDAEVVEDAEVEGEEPEPPEREEVLGESDVDALFRPANHP